MYSVNASCILPRSSSLQYDGTGKNDGGSICSFLDQSRYSSSPCVVTDFLSTPRHLKRLVSIWSVSDLIDIPTQIQTPNDLSCRGQSQHNARHLQIESCRLDVFCTHPDMTLLRQKSIRHSATKEEQSLRILPTSSRPRWCNHGKRCPWFVKQFYHVSSKQDHRHKDWKNILFHHNNTIKTNIFVCTHRCPPAPCEYFIYRFKSWLRWCPTRTHSERSWGKRWHPRWFKTLSIVFSSAVLVMVFFMIYFCHHSAAVCRSVPCKSLAFRTMSKLMISSTWVYFRQTSFFKWWTCFQTSLRTSCLDTLSMV